MSMFQGGSIAAAISVSASLSIALARISRIRSGLSAFRTACSTEPGQSGGRGAEVAERCPGWPGAATVRRSPVSGAGLMAALAVARTRVGAFTVIATVSRPTTARSVALQAAS